MKQLVKKFIFNKLFKDTTVFSDGSVVKYEENTLKIYPAKNTQLIFHGELKIHSYENITIQSDKILRLRGDILHLNDHKPAKKAKVV